MGFLNRLRDIFSYDAVRVRKTKQRFESVLSREYDLGRIRKIKYLSSGDSFALHKLFAERGLFVLSHGEMAGRPDLQERAEFDTLVRWLISRHSRLAAPSLMTKGGKFYVRDGQDIFFVTRFIEGETLPESDLNPVRLSSVARGLAEIQESVPALDLQHLSANKPPIESHDYVNALDTASAADKLQKIVWQFEAGPMAENRKLFCGESKFYLEQAALLQKNFSAAVAENAAAFRRSVLHNRLAGENLFFNGDTLASVADFSFATVDFRIFELANGLLNSAPGLLDYGKLAAFAADYEGASNLKLTAPERRALPEACRRYLVQEALELGRSLLRQRTPSSASTARNAAALANLRKSFEGIGDF